MINNEYAQNKPHASAKRPRTVIVEQWGLQTKSETSAAVDFSLAAVVFSLAAVVFSFAAVDFSLAAVDFSLAIHGILKGVAFLQCGGQKYVIKCKKLSDGCAPLAYLHKNT